MDAKVYINKLSAAQRQLKAAIRMFFAEEDELAIHTVVAAAYGILKDLKSQRGLDEAREYYLDAFADLVNRYRKGVLSAEIAADAELMAQVKEISEHQPSDLVKFPVGKWAAAVSDEQVRAFWRERTKIANFLKHADRDVDSTIAMDEIDNVELIALALCAYYSIAGARIGIEENFFVAYSSTELTDLASPFPKVTTKLRAMSPRARRKLCLAGLKQAKTRNRNESR